MANTSKTSEQINIEDYDHEMARCASIVGNRAPRDFKAALEAYRKAVQE